jgi:hypothetical protein
VHWLNTQWFAYWWPSDKGNGPEAITELVFIGVIGSFLIPRVRRFFKRHFEEAKALAERHHEEHLTLIAEHHKQAMRKADLQHAEHMTALAGPVEVVEAVKPAKKVAKKVPAKKVTKRQP